MDDEAPKRARRRGLRRCLWLAPPLIPIAALPVLNLWLASPLGRSWIAGKIHQRVGLETRIAGASVSPWNGIQVRGLEILQPVPLRAAVSDPLLKVENVKLTPVWRAWLRGRTEIQAIDLDSPRLVFPVEILADLAKHHTPPPPPAVAVNPPQTVPAPPPEKPAPPTAVTPVPSVPAPASIQLPPTGWLRVKNASFRFISASRNKELLAVSGIRGEVPVSGSPARSNLHIGILRILDDETLSGVEANLVWQPPFLTLQPLETHAHGVKLSAAGQAALVRGLPLQVDIQAPAQALALDRLPMNGRVETASFTSTARFRGFLLAPASWQGEWVAQCERVKVRAGENEAGFDRGHMITTLRGGVLQCGDARLIGDDLSLLGNAALLADGRLAAVLRIVAPPDAASAIGARLIPNPRLTPLSTPQRVAVDLHAAGNLQQIRIFQAADP
jgi:hypothetical protein